MFIRKWRQTRQGDKEILGYSAIRLGYLILLHTDIFPQLCCSNVYRGKRGDFISYSGFFVVSGGCVVAITNSFVPLPPMGKWKPPIVCAIMMGGDSEGKCEILILLPIHQCSHTRAVSHASATAPRIGWGALAPQRRERCVFSGNITPLRIAHYVDPIWFLRSQTEKKKNGRYSL